MYKGRVRGHWDIASQILAAIINSAGGDKGKAVEAHRFHPYAGEYKPSRPEKTPPGLMKDLNRNIELMMGVGQGAKDGRK